MIQNNAVREYLNRDHMHAGEVQKQAAEVVSSLDLC